MPLLKHQMPRLSLPRKYFPPGMFSKAPYYPAFSLPCILSFSRGNICALPKTDAVRVPDGVPFVSAFSCGGQLAIHESFLDSFVQSLRGRIHPSLYSLFRIEE